MDQATDGGTWGAWHNWREENYVIYEYNNGGEPQAGSGTVIVAVWRNTLSSGGISDGGADTTYVNSAFLCRWTFDGNYLYGCQNGGSMGINNLFNIKLNQEWIDLNDPNTFEPPEDYLGGASNPLDPENNQAPRCQPWDIACWFSATLDSVVDSFQSLANFFGDIIKGLGEWIANLIMPSNADGGFDNRFTDFFTTMDETLHERLGILLFPFDFMADFFNEIFSFYNPFGYDSGACSSGANLSIPNLLGEADVTFDLCAFANKMPALWTVMQGIANLAWIIGLIAFLHGKYFDIVKGGDNV